MSYIKGNPGNIQAAAEIVFSSFEFISPEAYDVRYPNIVFPDFIPAESLDTNVPEGDDIYSRRIVDKRGVGAFRAVGSNDINLVGFAQEKISTPMFNASVGSVLDLQDIARASSAKARGLGEDAVALATETMKIASDRHLEKLFFFGDTVQDGAGDSYFSGLLTDPNIPVSTVATGAGGNTEWILGSDSKTADEVIFDITTAINTVYFVTRGILIVNEVYLPLEQFAYITNFKAGTRANDETVFNFVSKQNVKATIDGVDITFRPLRYLEGAGVGGTNRMMVVAKSPDNYMGAMPIPFRLLTTDTFGFLQYLFAEYKVSPLKFPFPQFAGFWDGI